MFVFVTFVVFCVGVGLGFGLGVPKTDPAPSGNPDQSVPETYTVECFSGGVRIWSTDRAQKIFQGNGYVRVTTEDGKFYAQADCVMRKN